MAENRLVLRDESKTTWEKLLFVNKIHTILIFIGLLLLEYRIFWFKGAGFAGDGIEIIEGADGKIFKSGRKTFRRTKNLYPQRGINFGPANTRGEC